MPSRFADQQQIGHGDQIASLRFFLGHDHFDRHRDQLTGHFREMCAPSPCSGLTRAVRDQGYVPRQLIARPDVVERVELILAILDEAEGIEDRHLAPERFPVAACHGEILALDVEADNRPLVIEDRRDHGADALAAPCAGDDEVMTTPPSLRIVLDVAQQLALVQGEGQACLVCVPCGRCRGGPSSPLARARCEICGCAQCAD